SSIFGPRQVTGLLGGSVTVKCFYPRTNVNRHDRKYWCKESTRQCATVISSNGYIAQDFAGRATITDFPEQGIFIMELSKLGLKDIGFYKCGIGLNDRGLSFEVKLDVSQDWEIYPTDNIQKELSAFLVLLSWLYKGTIKKKKKRRSYAVMHGSLTQYRTVQQTVPCDIRQKYMMLCAVIYPTVQCMWGGLVHNDAGLKSMVKVSRAMVEQDILNWSPKVPEGAELYYKELGGSVTMNCVFGTQYASVRKYLCKMGKTGCSTVIDTYGNVNPTYKGRALLSPQETPGSFVIYMTQLRKEDSGLYLCGVGEYGETVDFPKKHMSPFVSPETAVPQGRHTINGVIGGSVSVECRYDPRRNYTLKYLCKWRKNGCTQLITNLIMMIDSYEGRIVMHDNPKNGTFTIIMNQLVAEDAGYYWCMTDGDVERKSSKELKIIDGQPGLTGLKEVNAVIGTRVTLSCSYPCKYYSYQKYWCKWNNRGCKPLVSYEQNQTSPAVNCDEENKTLYLTFNQVTQTNQGWYWCGVSHSGHYGETMAVFLRVNGGEPKNLPQGKNSQNLDPAIGSGKRADFPADSSSPRYCEDPCRYRGEGPAREQPLRIPEPDLLLPQISIKSHEHTRVLHICSFSSSQEHDNSKVILSVLIPIAVVCLLLGTVFVVVKFKLLKRTELVSVGSYRTNISMSEFDNPRELGAKENAGINNSQETQIGGVDEFVTVPANTESAEEPKVVKR
uniref:Polymeric immunoglobulin receptor n=1 Tax=Pelodiscus sinensis TaxID=13735 RepID=K7F6W0_PELSI